jgi:hypothetical protein
MFISHHPYCNAVTTPYTLVRYENDPFSLFYLVPVHPRLVIGLKIKIRTESNQQRAFKACYSGNCRDFCEECGCRRRYKIQVVGTVDSPAPKQPATTVGWQRYNGFAVTATKRSRHHHHHICRSNFCGMRRHVNWWP